MREVHVFARRGPAQAKFTPLELRELDHSPNVEVLVAPEDFEVDAAGAAASTPTTRPGWSSRSSSATRCAPRPSRRRTARASARASCGCTSSSRPSRCSATAGSRASAPSAPCYTEDGGVRGTGEYRDWPVQALYRCVGYRSTELPGLPWDSREHVVPHSAGRVLDLDGTPVPGVYVNGWVKRGPVGLIGHTKGDAIETVGSMLEDLPTHAARPSRRPRRCSEFLESRGVAYTTWDGWQLLDAHELALGEAFGPVGERARERVKVVDRETMVEVSRAVQAVEDGEPGAEQRLDEALAEADAQIEAATPQV